MIVGTPFLTRSTLALVFTVAVAGEQAQGPDGSANRETGAHVQAPGAAPREATVRAQAKGTFEVKLSPLGSDEAPGATPLGRMSLDKRFQGDLDGTSRGEMLTAMTPVKGSAGYVALERVTGTLHGRAGTFVLQHSGTMAEGSQQLTISVVPGSGTGQLAGLAGSMSIVIEGGSHSYEFSYTLPARE